MIVALRESAAQHALIVVCAMSETLRPKLVRARLA
jgi:hypothetical protein